MHGGSTRWLLRSCLSCWPCEHGLNVAIAAFIIESSRNLGPNQQSGLCLPPTPPVLLQSAPSSISYSSLESPDMTSSPPFWNPTPLSVRVIPSCTGTTSWSPVRTRSFISAFLSDVGRVIGRQFLQFRILRYCFYRTSPQQCWRDTDTAIISVRLSVRPSVCLSVTFWHCIETVSHVIILSSAYASRPSPVMRVSLALNSFAKFRRGHHYGAAEYTYGI